MFRCSSREDCCRYFGWHVIHPPDALICEKEVHIDAHVVSLLIAAASCGATLDVRRDGVAGKNHFATASHLYHPKSSLAEMLSQAKSESLNWPSTFIVDT